MATSARLGFFGAREAWTWALTGSACILLTLSVIFFASYRISYRKFLVSEVAKTLETNRQELLHGNFRSIFESLRTRIDAPYLSIKSNFAPFEWGTQSVLSICADSKVGMTKIRSCGNPALPTVPIFLVIIGIIALGGASRIVVNNVERLSIEQYQSKFAAMNLPAPVGSGAQELISHFSELKGALIESQHSQRNLLEKSHIADLAERVAHDIRSPLSALKVLSGSPSDMKSPEGQELLQLATERILVMAEDLSAASRRATAASIVSSNEPQLIDLALEMKRIVSEKQFEFRERKGVHLSLECFENTVTAKLEPHNFQRIFSNILNNSFEALRSEGGNIKVRLHPNAVGSIVEIEDDGIGIPLEVLNALNTNKTISYGKQHGMGIGLSSARDTLACVGGSLQIESRENNGTLVTICLPRS